MLFCIAGFNGCIGSSNVTSVPMTSCPKWDSNNHKGHTLYLSLRTYNGICSHTRFIMGSTDGHPSTWNDKTLIVYDTFLNKVNDGKKIDDYEFTLLEYTVDGNIASKTYKGVWFIVDNGYLS